MNRSAFRVRGTEGLGASHVWNSTRQQRQTDNYGNKTTEMQHNASNDILELSKGQEIHRPLPAARYQFS
jgi:hypothetical protein